MTINKYPHNQVVYDVAGSMLDRVHKAAMMHPTGTGTSFLNEQSDRKS